MDRLGELAVNAALALGLVLVAGSLVLVPQHPALAGSAEIVCLGDEDCRKPDCRDLWPNCLLGGLDDCKQFALPDKCNSCSCVNLEDQQCHCRL